MKQGLIKKDIKNVINLRTFRKLKNAINEGNAIHFYRIVNNVQYHYRVLIGMFDTIGVIIYPEDTILNYRVHGEDFTSYQHLINLFN
jgi:hypothetical protein